MYIYNKIRNYAMVTSNTCDSKFPVLPFSKSYEHFEQYKINVRLYSVIYYQVFSLYSLYSKHCTCPIFLIVFLFAAAHIHSCVHVTFTMPCLILPFYSTV